jgi:hypothetical protein
VDELVAGPARAAEFDDPGARGAFAEGLEAAASKRRERAREARGYRDFHFISKNQILASI